MKKKLAGVALVLAAVSLMSIQPVEACTRAVYIGPDQMVVTGRTMDWKEDIMTNIYVFPRGIQRMGHNKEKTVNWTSKYGSVIATGYDIGTCDGMNEKGLVASLLFLPESIYSLPGDTRPAMGISIWTQYVLDNFATVREAVDELKKETFRIDAPRQKIVKCSRIISKSQTPCPYTKIRFSFPIGRIITPLFQRHSRQIIRIPEILRF